ncbi:MAG: hypothetical protein ACRC6K_08205 [Fusobacteriaceae bacterium]
MEVTSKSIIKSNKVSTTEEISNQIKNILDLEKEIREITGSLNDKANDVSNYSNRGFFLKIINSKEIKWENHAVDVYKGIDLNLKLNKNNTVVIIAIFKLLVEQEKKIKENLNSINQITKNTDKHLKDYKIRLEKLNDFQKEIKKEKEASIEHVNQIIEKLDQGDQVSRELADILINRFNPAINENIKMNKSNSNEIQNAQEKLKGIDEYILELKKENLELHYEIDNLKENNYSLQGSITLIKETQNKFEDKHNFLKKLCLSNIILLPIALLGMSYFF